MLVDWHELPPNLVNQARPNPYLLSRIVLAL